MNTRTKQRTNTSWVVTPASWIDKRPPHDLIGRTLDARLVQRFESMTDSRKTKKAYNKCEHGSGILLTSASATGPHEFDTSNDRWEHVDVGSHLWHLSHNPSFLKAKDLVIGAGGDPDPDTIAFYMQRICKGPPQVLSLLNFLYELKDFKAMHDLWAPKLGLLHNIAHLRLGYKYGWELFLRDIVSILKSVLTLDKRIKAYLTKMGTVRHGRYRVRLGDQDRGYERDIHLSSEEQYINLHDIHFASFSADYDFIWKLERGYEVANIRYSYFVPELSAAQMQLRAILHAFGVEWNPRILWDAIPYSFVIDWFLSVGDWLEDWLASPILPHYVRVHDFSITRKAEVAGAVRFRWKTDATTSPPRYQYHTVSCRGKYYKRVVDVHPLPKRTHLINAGFSEFGRTRFLNGAALVIVNTRATAQRMPRRQPPKPSGRKRKNPLLGKGERQPRVKFTWPDRPWCPKPSKEFWRDFNEIILPQNRRLWPTIQQLGSEDILRTRSRLNWAVRYKLPLVAQKAAVYIQ